ncbi:hypothetical protein LXL04_003270 [Taraxacum kok-saghyz]
MTLEFQIVTEDVEWIKATIASITIGKTDKMENLEHYGKKCDFTRIFLGQLTLLKCVWRCVALTINPYYSCGVLLILFTSTTATLKPSSSLCRSNTRETSHTRMPESEKVDTSSQRCATSMQQQSYKALLNQQLQKLKKQRPIYQTQNEGSIHHPKFRTTVLG